ncbi:MAG: hypothetical protein ACRDQU_13355 [Pseudonocardiaceae bacterium]
MVDGLLESFGGAAATLRTAAVLGPRLDLDLVAGVLGRSASAVLDDLDTGVRARLLVERESGLEFGHELFREAAAASVSPIRRRLLHREAATVLAARPRRDPLTIAWHARRGDAPELASTELVAAARLAVRCSDLDAADVLLAEALELDPTVQVQLASAEVALRRGDLARAARGTALAGQVQHSLGELTAAVGLPHLREQCGGPAATAPHPVRGDPLVLNRARLPVEKVEVIAQFRAALAGRSWDTNGWFDQQLALCQLAMISAFGWEKALGAGDSAGDEELGWWQQRALAAARILDEAAPGWR